MKIKSMILATSVAMFFSLSGCGGTADRQTQDDMKKTVIDSSALTEENYIDLAKFHYSQSFMARGASKSRTMQHLDKAKVSRSKDKNSFYIKSSKSSDNEIESFIISKGNRLISVEIGSKDVKISLHGSKKVARETLSLDAFRNLDIQQH